MRLSAESNSPIERAWIHTGLPKVGFDGGYGCHPKRLKRVARRFALKSQSGNRITNRNIASVKTTRYSLRSIQWRQRPCKTPPLCQGIKARRRDFLHHRIRDLIHSQALQACPFLIGRGQALLLEAGTARKIGSEHHMAWPVRPCAPGCSGSEEGDDKRSDRCREMHGTAVRRHHDLRAPVEGRQLVQTGLS